MAAKRVRVVVSGRVQGVYFRAYTQEEARRLGLIGWVRNRPDGAVEAEVEGEGAEVERMVQWLHRGSPLAQVSQVGVQELEPTGLETGFEVRYRY